MHFKHPELLYALFLLLIPIIVHLFQLRRFQKVAFTNVAFLKAATLKTRKSSQIKKWLVLTIRLMLFAAIILAFTQPYTTKKSTYNTEKETVIYLDNSFSMQAKGNQGELLKRAVQDIINNVPDNETISLITNDNTYKNTNVKTIKNELLQLEYTSSALTNQAAILKAKSLFSKRKNTLKNLVFISDFQLDASDFKPATDSLEKLHLVKLQPVNNNNVAIDSVFVSKTTASSIELTVNIKNSGEHIENLPVSLFNNDTLIAKTSISIDQIAQTNFSIPTKDIINGRIAVNDVNLAFDNNLFFNITNNTKINVLSINASDDSFLKRIYTADEFNYLSTLEEQLNYNILDKQHLIILNELETLPNALISALKLFTSQGGSIIIIPSATINQTTYNTLLSNYNTSFNAVIEAEKRITTINYSHPLFSNGVFEKQVKNFQYPKLNSFYTVSGNLGSPALQFEDGQSFLLKSNNAYIFTAALNATNSNFKNSPLIVPTLYNIGRSSFKTPNLYYTIGKQNSYDIETQLQQDDILALVNDPIRIIPKQQYFNNKVVINTFEAPALSGVYEIKNKNKTIKNVSYNYDRSESNLIYRDLSSLKQGSVNNSITDIFNAIKSDTKVNALWKWFVIFALILLIIEMLILKYFK
ncbi:vWA domain-containing protein [Snuella sedimenti]|uniref:BatA and WFA domain-containing protein n=1 Tax=Snuella sedimenti TaxID=2798802 RepID=A0A8J7IIN4_9FLAO|nr:BatA and WFA domain-containing protein [Snuella sedimenti]MBJ6369031.1 BatA and WFA domain-containing protein [Snuella sedimenti]